jgi:hypothetical protein
LSTLEEAGALLLAGKLAGALTDDKTKKIVDSALYKIKAVLKNNENRHAGIRCGNCTSIPCCRTA